MTSVAMTQSGENKHIELRTSNLQFDKHLLRKTLPIKL